MISIRKLAAVDMALHGPRLIIAEFAIGILFPAVLGFLMLRSGLSELHRVNWMLASAFWLAGTAANYVPLFIYAVLIARSGTVEKEGRAEIARISRYNTQQFIILIPLMVVVLALLQERRRKAQD